MPSVASNVKTTAGTIIAVSSAAPATYNAAGFGALTFTSIGEVTDLGSVGRKYNIVKHQPIANRAVVKRKGTYDNGTASIKLGRDLVDAGQVLLDTAAESDSSYSFKITLQSGKILYFSAQVASFTYDMGGADTIFGGTVELEVDNDIVVV